VFGWNAAELAALDPDPSARQPPWRLTGDLDWDEIELVRVVSAHLDDGRLLAIAALRPTGSGGHGEEVIAGALGDLGADEFDPIEETLLSVEYDGAGDPRRVGLELYRAEGGIPLRAAGDAVAVAHSHEGQLERVSASLRMRLAGVGGTGLLDVVRPAS
jgi:hypothetical protein